MGGSGLRLRLTQSAQNLGLDMPMAHQLIPRHDSEDGQSYFLFAVALAHEDQYRQLLDEVDRLTVQHMQNVEQSLAEGKDLSSIDQLLHDYSTQDVAGNRSSPTNVLEPRYEALGKYRRALTPHANLLAEYEAQIRAADIELERSGRDHLLEDYHAQTSWDEALLEHPGFDDLELER